MLRDFKFLRQNYGKSQNIDEIENVPINPNDATSNQTSSDANRAPLHLIPEQTQNPKPHELGFKRKVERTPTNVGQELGSKSKFERTPTKAKGKSSDATLPLRTPEKQGNVTAGRNKFGFSSMNECRDEGRSQMVNYLGQSGKYGGSLNLTPRVNRTSGRTNSGYSESTSTQSTPTRSVNKPLNPRFAPTSSSCYHGNGAAHVGSFAASYRGLPVSSGQMSVLNAVEVPHFDLKEDPSFWMDRYVQVIIRVRPLNSVERSTYGYNRCVKQESAQSITWIGQPETRFTFDHVACETVDQETLFRMTGVPMVENCLSGYNSCMFAYGQTGSGKTYTMLGENEGLEFKPSPNRGMTPRIFEFLFARIRAEEESRRDERLEYNCRCSFLEIYNEQITDLLDPSSTNLLLREDVKKGVYVENLSEFEVHTVKDVMKLLSQGSANRKVAATTMNKESSRSHSVFTCVIESKWERDSTTNLRFARLNLVDLAGSERQKTSGAEGERLKEAANINKSLSTLGHVIMLLIDIANGKARHVPYRDSRLTFLLQDSLGGNSKTMIIANISPSICCAPETLNTLKFAQRAKLIQNNAVVNEDSSGDVAVLQHQIRLLQEELSSLKRQSVSRCLSFYTASTIHMTEKHGNNDPEKSQERDRDMDNNLSVLETGSLNVSLKQLKSLENILAGALRREQMAETSIQKLEAEIEQLNRLVHQREEDTKCTKMMLKFREDKIQRMESLLGGLKAADAFLIEENAALSEEIRLLQAKIDRNPEVTRFALENIRLLEQLRRFQDFYEEGEREILLSEVSRLRDQMIQCLDGSNKHHNHPTMRKPAQSSSVVDKSAVDSDEKETIRSELHNTQNELVECQSKLKCCLESNMKLSREIDDLHALLGNVKNLAHDNDNGIKVKEVSMAAIPHFQAQAFDAIQKATHENKHEDTVRNAEEVVNLELELDILKIILKEERSFKGKMEELISCLSKDLKLAEERGRVVGQQCENAKEELKEAKSIIEALESQQLQLINEIEDLRSSRIHYQELLHKQEPEMASLMKNQESNIPSSKRSETEESPLHPKLMRMQASLDKAKQLNMWFQSDRALQRPDEEEMDEIHRQAEAETAEVIISLQEELSTLQQRVHESDIKEKEAETRLMVLDTRLKNVQDTLDSMMRDNDALRENLQHKDREIKSLSEDWQLLSNEIEEALVEGHQALLGASDQLDSMSSSSTNKREWISEQFGRIIIQVYEKELLIKELTSCLEEANSRSSGMESMLRSLRGAATVITETHQQESVEKDREILHLRSELSAKSSAVMELESKLKVVHDKMKTTSTCATAAFLIINRLSQINSSHLDELRISEIQLKDSVEMNQKKDTLLADKAVAIDEARRQIESLSKELRVSEDSCSRLRRQLLEQEKYISEMQRRLEEHKEHDIMEAKENLNEINMGVASIRTRINQYGEQDPNLEEAHNSETFERVDGFIEENTCDGTIQEAGKLVSHCLPGLKTNASISSPREGENFSVTSLDGRCPECMRNYRDGSGKDITITLLRKEIENAVQNLKKVQAEMAHLCSDKEEISRSRKQAYDCLDFVKDQVLHMQTAFTVFEKHCEEKVMALNHKLQKLEETSLETCCSLCQTKECFDFEITEAKTIAAQKTAEASCLLARFEEAQDTMKEADIMINGLMIANESKKLEIEELKSKNAMLSSDRESLMDELQNLRIFGQLKEQQYEALVKNFELDLEETNILVQELQNFISLLQCTSEEAFLSLQHDLHSMKSDAQQATELLRSSLEEIWSEIIVKDSAVFVLHLCHIGVLLEAVNGLNAEYGLLHHGICESNAIISDLKEQNMKSRQELQLCRMLKGKLLSDIRGTFDRISRKENEGAELGMKMSAFEEKILDLQIQEELMLERSRCMGSELALLMEDLDKSNSIALASILEQDQSLKENVEATKSQAENLAIELSAKDFELLILASELQCLAHEKAIIESNQIIFHTASEQLLKEIVILGIDRDLKGQLLLEKETDVTRLQNKICLLEFSSVELQNRLLLIEEENRAQKNELLELKKGNAMLLKEVQDKNSQLKFSASCIDGLGLENHRLHEMVSALESRVSNLEEDLENRNANLNELHCSQSSLTEALCGKTRDSESYIIKVNELQEENNFLKDELRALGENKFESLDNSSFHVSRCIDLADAAGLQIHQVFNQLDETIKMLNDQVSQEACQNAERLSKLMEELDFLSCTAKELISENLSLQDELLRKDDILKGLLFDLSLLQESAANTKDQKDEIEELMASLEATAHELEIRAHEVDEALTHVETLETQLKEKEDMISSLEMDLSKSSQSIKLLTDENVELRSCIEDLEAASSNAERELMENISVIETLEGELYETGNNVNHMNDVVESLKSDLYGVTSQRDDLMKEVVILEEKVGSERVLVEENKAIAAEAQQLAESRRIYAEEKEEEVKLLETSVLELDSTINVLENKVDILKGEAERQRLQREELELEVHSLKHLMHNIESADGDIKWHLDEKEKSLQEALKKIEILEKDLGHRDTEISQCKAHISELNLHAEAQASEYKKKFKELESMVEQVRADGHSSHGRNTSCNKLEKNPSKARGSSSPFKAKGSGSPFKCIGLGLAQQLKSEKDEDLTAERLRIAELEALAASRQKEIFMLNTRLAAAESMTHDVIRDLLGVKMDMSNYVSLLDNAQVRKTTEKAHLDAAKTQLKDDEVDQLKKQLSEFVEERQGWLDEIDRRQAELIAAQVTLEKLRQQDQQHTAENKMLKMDIANCKKRVSELEREIMKLSGQQNLQQRIHHHAKIKEENNMLKVQNEELSTRLRRTERMLTRVKEELAQYRSSSGRSPYLNFIEEDRLSDKLKETEEERLHLAQKLLGLCTSILKAAGITKPTSEINLEAADEALEQLRNHAISLERELQDLKLKERIANERTLLSELMPRTSPLSSRSEEHLQTPGRVSQGPLFTVLER